MSTQLFIKFLLCEFNTALEMMCFIIVPYNLLSRKVSLRRFSLIIFFIISSLLVIIDLTHTDEIKYMLLTSPMIILIIEACFGQGIIRSTYLFAITYSFIAILQSFLVFTFRFMVYNRTSVFVMLIGNVATLILAIPMCKFLPIHHIYEFVLKKDSIFRIILGNIFISIFFITCMLKVNIPTSIASFPILGAYILLTISFNIALIKFKVQIDNQQNIINSYNEYLPVVDELIHEVRAKQHEYNNHLSALRSLSFTCMDYDSLKRELSENIDYFSNEVSPVFLLSFNLKLLSGFLFSKYNAALTNDIKLAFDISNYNVNTSVPEYIIVEMTGILIDNAVEACNCGDIVFINIDCRDNKFILTVKNPGPVITTEFSNHLFKKGYSTKNNPDSKRGYGLNNLKNKINQYNGKINIGNEEIMDKNYLYFRIEV